jgi:hypothetical protein
VTITDSPTHTAEVDELQLLFREAKQRRRRRWLISGIATLAFLVVVGMVVGLSVAQGGGRSSRPQVNPAPAPPPAAVAADAAFSIRPVLCFAPPYSGASGAAPTNVPLPTCSASTALTATNLQVEPASNIVTGYTYRGDQISADPQFATYPSTTSSNNKQGQVVLLPGALADGPSRYVLGPVGLNRSAIAHARVTEFSGQWAVDLVLTRHGSAQWDSFAERTFHEISAVVINGHVVSAPIMQPTQDSFTSFGGQLQISGGFTQRQAQTIAAGL